MVGFKKKKVKTQTLGEKLKQIRTEMNVSLNEIAKNTKVRKYYLEMIEEGQFEKLPPDVYVRGFLTSYAEYLGIEPADAMRLYEKERGIERSVKMMKNRDQGIKKGKLFEFPVVTVTPKMLFGIFFSALVLIGGIYFYRELGEFSKAPRLVILHPASNLSIEGNTVEITGITDKEGKIRINQQPIFVNDKGEFRETISLQKGANEIEVKAINRFENEESRKITISANYENEIDSKGGREKVMGAQVQKKETVKLEVKVIEEPTWVLVEVDNREIQNGTMLPGAIQIFEGQEHIVITTGKANKTMIVLNGEDLGAVGEERGIVRDVTFTLDSKRVSFEGEDLEKKSEEKNEKLRVEKNES